MTRPGDVWVNLQSQAIEYDDGARVRGLPRAYINVRDRDWGATGDGTTDDAPAIQRALDSGFSRVYIPAGSYRVNSGLVIPSGLSLEGDGGASIIDGSNMAAGGVIVTAQGSGLTSLGSPNADPTKHGYTLSFASAPSVLPRDVLIIYNPTDSSWNAARTYYRAGEFCQVRNLSGTTIELTSPLYSGYTAASITVYKVGTTTGAIRNLKLIAPAANTTYPILARFASDYLLENLILQGSDYGELLLDRCFNVSGKNITAAHLQTASSSTDYGIITSNCQHVRISDSHLVAYRHGFATGGTDVVGGVPNRDIRVTDSTIITTSNNVISALDLHGNSEWCDFDGLHVEGGVTLAGDQCRLINSTIRSRGNSGVAGIYFTEMLGWNFTIDNVEINSNGGLASRGAAIDLGGNATAAGAETTRGGTLLMRDIRLIDDASSPTALELVRIRNRGCTSDFEIVFDGVTIEVVSTALGFCYLDTVSGSSPAKATLRRARANRFSINWDDMGSLELDDIDVDYAEAATDCIDIQITQNNSVASLSNILIRNPTQDGVTIFGSGAPLPSGCVARISDVTILNTVSTYYGIEVLNGWATAFVTGCHASGSGTNLRASNLTTLIALGNSSPFSTATVTTLLELSANATEILSSSKLRGAGELELDGALNHDGTAAGFYGATPAGQSTGWSVTNDTTDKSYDANATTVDELADVLATLINHLKTIGILGA